MSDLENKYNAVKAKLRTYNILTGFGSGLVIVGIILMIVHLCVKNNVTEILNYVSLGIFGTVLVGFIILYFVFRNDLKEYKNIKNEMIKEKKQR